MAETCSNRSSSSYIPTAEMALLFDQSTKCYPTLWKRYADATKPATWMHAQNVAAGVLNCSFPTDCEKQKLKKTTVLA